tara:strand:- start:776 stop:1312 length:537 start_codon:yes stop_codon:yes gene_type:complete
MYNSYAQGMYPYTKGIDPYAMYQPTPEKNYIKIFMGCALIIINIMAFLSITVFCGKNFPFRNISSTYYSWFVAFTSICFTIGIIGLILNIIPFTKPIVMFIFPFTSSILSILIGAFATTYVAMTLAAVNKSGPDKNNPDKKCNTHTTVAIQVMGVSVLLGAIYIYYGYYPPPEEDDYY